MTPVYVIFHLNLAFSSISIAQRKVVIERCYTPLLDLIEHQQLPLGIEMTAWTLHCIESIDAAWVARFRTLLSSGQCELIGSGYAQIIGPLVPYPVNQWNQQMGVAGYQQLLGVTPALAMVNEMAYSSGMVELYADAGYQGIVMDRDNVMLALGMSDGCGLPSSHAQGCDGAQLPVLWSDTTLFQKLQRYAHGDISRQDYLNYFSERAAQSGMPLPLYSNDAEVFDFRPARFNEESVTHQESEWSRIAALFCSLDQAQWSLPSQAIALQCKMDQHDKPICLTSVQQPIPVKKQAKYNISRWAVTGRNDLWLNTLCHRIYQAIRTLDNPQYQRRLCEFWASDLRTHIGDERWQHNLTELEQFCQRLNISLQKESGPADKPGSAMPSAGSVFKIEPDDEGIYLTISHRFVQLTLNLRRGLSIESLAFEKHNFEPVAGTLSQGYFDSIGLAADFYSACVVIELPKEHRRVTDLEWAEPVIERLPTQLKVTATHNTPYGEIIKSIMIDAAEQSVNVQFSLKNWSHQHAVVRFHALTLMSGWQKELVVESRNGGPKAEFFALDGCVEHGQPASNMISCTTGLSGESGRIILHNRGRSLTLSWNPSHCAALPMLHHQISTPGALSRVLFSLSEIDETKQGSGDILPFSLKYRAG